MDSSVDPTTIGAFVTIILAFLGVAKIMLNQATKDREADREERIRLAGAIENMAKSSEKVATSNAQIATEVKQQSKEIKTGNEQSAERNGHLGELIVNQSTQTQKIADIAVGQILDGVHHVETQHVIKQNIDKSTVKDETVEHETVKDKE